MNGFTLLITALLIIGCSAKQVRYPDATKPCIMIDMNANLTLLLKSNSSMKAESTLDGGAKSSGECKESESSVDLLFASGVKGNLDFKFTLGADSNVMMDLALTFTPDSIFSNGDNVPRIATTVSSTKLSTMTASYTCTAPRVIKFNPVEGKDGEVYDFSMTISDVKIQAFNVTGTSYSPAEDCTAIDGLTTEAAMTTKPPVQTTEKNNETTSEAPPAPSGPSTEPTTKPPTNESTSEAPVVTTQPTKPPTNESTSEAPVTTPAKPTTPAPPVYPTPAPGAPSVNTYKAANRNGTCLMFKAGIEFTLPILVKGVNVTKTLGINKEDTSNETEFAGDCDASNTTQTMTVTFYKTSTMLMTFTKSDTGYYFSDVDITFIVDKELFPEIDREETMMVRKTFTKDQFAADKDGSYKCNDKSELEVQGVNFRTYNLQYAAFQKNITEFKSSGISECSADSDTNSVVPIAVGAALAGLVVIVLIAYLIGRKRSRQSGYEQV
ncbi:lysosomal-associated membrane protein 1/2 [Mytilus galloprovincialis]|uniref:Lysosome-associated membrane glycoprotein 5 n=1 Tax=Mytilus galloprovincialis TaxID=29158 RepID=A0A8B6HCL9_MYTGA|nr:lysosomal-associated membrane protein 1/2 [Mytilus galloprovincialis]